MLQTFMLSKYGNQVDTIVLCQVINDWYIGRGNPAPTNGFTHHLSVDRTIGYKPCYHPNSLNNLTKKDTS